MSPSSHITMTGFLKVQIKSVKTILCCVFKVITTTISDVPIYKIYLNVCISSLSNVSLMSNYEF